MVRNIVTFTIAGQRNNEILEGSSFNSTIADFHKLYPLAKFPDLKVIGVSCKPIEYHDIERFQVPTALY
jgi:hypothetical protein